jgi:hypothetical protein
MGFAVIIELEWPVARPRVIAEWASACPHTRGELRPFCGRGCGPLGYVCWDAITCLSHRIVDLGHGLFSGRRATLNGSHGVHWRGLRCGPTHRRTVQSAGPCDVGSGHWWRRRPTSRGQRPTQDGIDLGHQRGHIGIQIQNLEFQTPDSFACRQHRRGTQTGHHRPTVAFTDLLVRR